MIQDACVCGAVIRVSSLDPEEDAEVVAVWQARHVGAGHAACSAAEANRTRNHWTTRPSGRAVPAAGCVTGMPEGA